MQFRCIVSMNEIYAALIIMMNIENLKVRFLFVSNMSSNIRKNGKLIKR